MREFCRTLEERLRHSERQHERYWGDEAYRLRMVNNARRRLGLPLAESIGDIRKRGQKL